GKKASAATPPSPPKDRSGVRVGIPKVLNMWSTHQFWVAFLREIGIASENIVFSSDTSEEQGREFGKGRGTVDCCYPVKAMSGHYGELVFGQKKKLHVILSPMIYSLPSFMRGHTSENLACTRVMAGPENIRAGFVKESDVFGDNGIRYAAPFVNMAEPEMVPKQMYDALKDVFDLDMAESQRAVDAGYKALRDFNAKAQAETRKILTWCARNNKPCVMVLARPYHMDPGIGHEIEGDLQAHGYPIVWLQYMPVDADLLDWVFGEEVQAKKIRSPLDISDVWTSSNSSNTNEIMWGAKFAARFPWITCVLRLSSYECGMDQPTYTPVQKTVEAAGTLFFKFGDLDSTKPAGSIRIRIETIVHYLGKYSDQIMQKKLALLPPDCPLLQDQPESNEKTLAVVAGTK
ncbi:MAG TPA: acyl-CoA dehydratase activase-related protein, partial [Candidatus Acidoferrales bacterium]|nr:acyl-CoA dehydratase activase-related protein [Candidatus Acidoferrales bacterium]